MHLIFPSKLTAFYCKAHMFLTRIHKNKIRDAKQYLEHNHLCRVIKQGLKKNPVQQHANFRNFHKV